ncbi:amino acid/amide ABC transporter ATP-binding protein 2, HAAT family [Jatrophihabitans endophyticus]|uniref:Amino acid/amide ABC transporter ATP-binding protein 2, HAAT family n=1 Tax=Jatrophihabitans endophyticus TaxID=1206085 RepID=A0A1M5CYY1_9ACTN|nr:ABC transporter ATP-binding protein [Jatrophihabitans endophyticus]SHF59847.1 amino acid/amide ABC transporter ATP-binding protein 2, HAAT family [Jatrophihabitans endophyticus]
MALLELTDVSVSYGRIEALHNINVSVDEGRIVTLIGANGAGKTTTMRAISGLRPLSNGRITFQGEDISRLRADLRVVRGISQAPEGRGVFPGMTVADNLDMGAYARKDRKNLGAEFDHVYDLFPRLKERRTQTAGTMSGGEQQMLAIGRALMAKPKLLLLDEPSMGLAPLIVKQIFDILRQINADGVTILVVEQNASKALALADWAYVLETGAVALDGSGSDLLVDDRVRALYLGGEVAS